MRRFFISFAIGAVLLGGCARFHSKPLSPAATAAALEGRALTNAVLKAFLEENLHQSLTDWPMEKWDFDTLTLVAFFYNPTLEVARADWRVATAGETTAAARPNPTVTASGIYEPAAGAFSPWIPGVVFDLPLETMGKRRYRTEQARHLSESARLDLASAAWQVRSRLRLSLLDYVSARQRLALVQGQLALRREQATRLEQQLQAGAISRFELNTAQLALVRANADLADAQRAVGEALPRLAEALGVPADALEGVAFDLDLTSAAAAETMTSTEARDLALRGRSDVLGALAQYAASQSALQLEIAKQYPDIHLSPGYSWNAGSTGEHDWQVGATLELPLLNHNQGAVAEALAKRESSAARFLALQAKVINELDGALAAFRNGQTNAATLESFFQAQNAQQQAVAQQVQSGAADRLDVLNSELELNAAAVTRLEAQVRLQQALGALEDAVQRPYVLPDKAVFQSSRSHAP